mgnify:CR=1 FL=1
MLILENCLDLLEQTRAEREALDLRDLEAIRPLLPTSHTTGAACERYGHRPTILRAESAASVTAPDAARERGR